MTEEGVAKAPVERFVEVLRRERRELGDERRVAYDGGEEVPLSLEPGLEEAGRRCRRDRRRPGRPRGSKPRECLSGKIEPVGEEPQRLLPLGGVLDGSEDLAGPHERLLPVVRPLERDADAIVEVALGRPQAPRERLGRVGGILALRQSDDAHVEPLPHRQLHPAQGRLLPCRVGVEAEKEALRQPAELAELGLGQCRAHRRDDRLDPGLAERDHVRVPLYDDRAVLLRDGRARQMEPVEDVALLEQLALRRVDVLTAERVVVPQLAGPGSR